MELSNKLWGTIGIIILVFLAVLFMALRDNQVLSPVEGIPIASPEGEGSLIVEGGSATEASQVIVTFAVNPKDIITVWKFVGRYVGNETLTINAQTDIARLQSLLGTGKYPDYDLYNGIGNNYTYLGDGEKAFAAYKKAMNLAPKRALVYMNIGNLMEQLKAYNTAKDAYAKAVALEPEMAQYQSAQADFLARQFPEN